MIVLPFALLIPDLLVNFLWQIYFPSPATVLMRYYKENPQINENETLMTSVVTKPAPIFK